MERVLGIGGFFLRAADPAALSAWYREALGLAVDDNGSWRQDAGMTVFATFDSTPDVAEQTQDADGIGQFGWVTDPEGNRIELWQPA